MVSVEAPRVRVFHRLAQALAATACQSTPLCSWKRLSSLSTMARSSAGEVSASGTQGSRRTDLSTRSVCTGTPWRSSSVISEGLCAALWSSPPRQRVDQAAEDRENSRSIATSITMPITL